MRNRPLEPIELDLTIAGSPESDLNRQLTMLAPRLAEARRGLQFAGPALLEDYRQAAGRGDPHSRLGQLLAIARRLADEADRVVLVASRDACLAAQALLDCCTHPFHNELSRAARGGYPRVYLEAGPADNDHLQALLDLLTPPIASVDLEHRWALVTIDDGTLETALVSRVLVQALKRHVGSDRAQSLHATLSAGEIAKHGEPLNAAALLSAALAGLDVVGLLSGAAAMQARSSAEPLETNPVLRLAGLCHRSGNMLSGHSAEACQLAAGAKSLSAAAAWYRNLRQTAFAAPSFSPPADLHADRLGEKIRHMPLLLNVVAERVRRDRLMIDAPRSLNDPLAAVAEKKLPEITQAIPAAGGAAGQIVGTLRLPQMKEPAVGQMLQLLAAAVAVETQLANAPSPGSR